MPSIVKVFLISFINFSIFCAVDFKSGPFVRVRVKKSVNKIKISGTDIKRNLHLLKDVKRFDGKKSIQINCKDFYVSKKKGPALLASIASPTGLLTLEKEKYSGGLHIITSPSGKACDVINEIDIRDYLSSLLSREMNAVWPREALKAQAIAARTYALHKIKTKFVSRIHKKEVFYDLENSEKHQVSGNYFDSTENTQKAVSETKGEILTTKDGRVTPVFFHAKCGGRTILPRFVWENKVRGYKSVKCPYCKGHGIKNWKNKITTKRFKKFIKWLKEKKKIPHHYDGKIILVRDKSSKDFFRFYLGSNQIVLKKSILRRYFGRVIVKSNNYRLSKVKRGFIISGQGLGHGVGMCQLGVLDLAKQGYDYKRILSHYFPNHVIKRAY